jgi:hypothetical protein
MLSAFIWIPFIVAAAIAFYPFQGKEVSYRRIALITTISLLLLNILLGFQFDPASPGMQFGEYLPWIDWLGLNYHLGIDGLSFPLLFAFLILPYQDRGERHDGSFFRVQKYDLEDEYLPRLKKIRPPPSLRGNCRRWKL